MGLKIFAIELTNFCNAKCSFCPYPTKEHNRPRGYLGWRTVGKIIDTIQHPAAVNLSGLGEPTLHKNLVDIVRALRSSRIEVQLNTNGKLLDQGLYDKLVQAGLTRVVITSDYFPWDKGKLEVVQECPVVLQTITRDPELVELGQVRKPLDDWGGRHGDVDRVKVRCSYLYEDFLDITWDGLAKRCHVDFNLSYVLGSIWDPLFLSRYDDGFYKRRKIPFCDGCSGYVFKNGLTVGDYDGDGEEPRFAFGSQE